MSGIATQNDMQRNGDLSVHNSDKQNNITQNDHTRISDMQNNNVQNNNVRNANNNAQNDHPHNNGEQNSEASKNSSQPIRVAVVDDHEMFRAGVIATLQPYFTIVGQSPDVEGAVAMIEATQPDVVLLDVHVPGGTGGGGAEILASSHPLSPNSVFLALSVSDSPQDVGAVIRAGARGYVTKTITADDLISSIKQVHEGYAVFSPKLAGFVLSAFRDASAGAPTHDDELDRLSAREQEVMRLIARGYTYKEVASELFISIKTVETHMSSVLRKLQLSNRTELTRWAADRRIV